MLYLNEQTQFPSIVDHMTPKSSMATEVFLKWLGYFAKVMFTPPAVNGTPSHLDATIANKAESMGVEFFVCPTS
ncbi:hypothetical protein Trydic_g16518 [Trypoxylus dichotomus]